MPEIIETTVYTYDELSDKAKEKAREWFITNVEFDHAFVIDDFKERLATFGCDVENVYYSGFCSQGDGASFTGSWSFKKGWRKAFLSAYPHGTKMLAKLDEIAAQAKKCLFGINVKITRSGRYSHSGTMDFVVEWDCDRHNPWDKLPEDVEEHISTAFRCLAGLLYRELEEEYWYQTSDEVVAENIAVNEYTFTADGRRFG